MPESQGAHRSTLPVADEGAWPSRPSAEKPQRYPTDCFHNLFFQGLLIARQRISYRLKVTPKGLQEVGGGSQAAKAVFAGEPS
jgi:hypothetical protein